MNEREEEGHAIELRRSEWKPDSLVRRVEQDGRAGVLKVGAAKPLLRESEILGSIDHPGIPKVLEYKEDGVRAELLIEEKAGESLHKVLEMDASWHGRALDEDRAAQIARGLAGCLSAVSDAGYLYRDLSLEHILVDGEKVSLVDFEMCVPKNADGTAVATRGGTWEMMSPEEFQPGANMTEASSVYSLGVILLQMRTGENPFFISDGMISDENLAKEFCRLLHLKGPMYIPGEHSPLDEVMRVALDPDPSRRYQTLDDFESAVEDAIAAI